MDIVSFSLIFVALANLAPAGIVIFRNPSDKANRAFSLFALFVSLWTFGLAMFRNSEFINGLHWTIF